MPDDDLGEVLSPSFFTGVSVCMLLSNFYVKEVCISTCKIWLHIVGVG